MASRWLTVDKTLFLVVASLIGTGLVMVYSASFPISQRVHAHGLHFVTRQAVAVGVGMAAMALGLAVDYRRYRHPLVVASAVLGAFGLLVVVLLMPTINNVHRWIPIGGFNVQASEVAKIVAVLFLAFYLSRKDERINDPLRGLLPPLSIIGAMFLLIAIEPDLGTALMLMGTASVMFWVAGLSWKYVANVVLVVGALGAISIARSGYQLQRIVAFLDPWAHQGGSGYQTVQSLLAVGSGGLTGVGFAAGQQKSGFLPYPYTDFIYAVVAEEFGLIGAGTVALCFLVILWRGVRASLRAPDSFGFYLGIGLTCMIVLQALINMSIVINLLPTTGIPLPLISYGGSSMVVSCAAIGVLLNISQHAHT